MLPQYERLKPQNGSSQRSSPLIIISFHKLVIYVALLPTLSFTFCVFWCLVFFFDASTSTHCGVYNYLPSISSAIGNYQPQRFVWQLAICLQFLPRLMVAKLYQNYYAEEILHTYYNVGIMASIFNVIEIFALLGLSLWTSVYDYEVHKFCFVAFVVTSEIYMLLSYLLNKYGRRLKTLTKIEEKSLKCKFILFIINVTSICLAVYCYFRHNNYCEPLVYTYFALFEFFVVFTNIGFHMTAYFDFYGKNLTFDWKKGCYLTHH